MHCDNIAEKTAQNAQYFPKLPEKMFGFSYFILINVQRYDPLYTYIQQYSTLFSWTIFLEPPSFVYIQHPLLLLKRIQSFLSTHPTSHDIIGILRGTSDIDLKNITLIRCSKPIWIRKEKERSIDSPLYSFNILWLQVI